MRRWSVTLSACSAVAALLACSPFGEADTVEAPADAGTAADAAGADVLDGGTAREDSGLARMTWNFTNTQLGFGFTYENQTEGQQVARDTTVFVSEPAAFRSTVVPRDGGVGQSAARYGFRPYPNGAAKKGRYRLSFSFWMDCNVTGDATPGLAELYCADAPAATVLNFSYGGTNNDLRFRGQHKASPGAANTQTYAETTIAPLAKEWHRIAFDVVFGTGDGAFAVRLDDAAIPGVDDATGIDMGCAGSQMALQLGTVETFGNTGGGSCTVVYDDVVFEYPP